MRTLFTFVVKHWLTLGLLVGSVALVTWIVQTKRPPGAMTLVESSGMDMTAMKPPPGVFPVAVEPAEVRPVGESASFPAEVLAYSDEDVIARVMGRVKKVLVYPGDRVRAGQLLATLDADEYVAMAGESRLMAAAKANMALASQRMIDEQRAMLAKAKAGVTTAQAGIARAEADVDAMKADRLKAGRELEMAKAEIDQMQADLTYAEQEFARSQKLHSQGAISLDELQAVQRERDKAAAMVRGTQAKSRSAEEGVRVADKRITASQKMVDEAKSMAAAAESERSQAQSGLRRAEAEARGARSEAQSARSGAAGAATMADYRNLRALSDAEVSDRMVSPGTAVMPGMVVLRLKVVDKVRVQAEIPQAQSAKVKVGSPIVIEGEGFERGSEIASVFPTVSADSRTFRIEAVISNPDRAIKPGMFVTVRIASSDEEEAIAVRASAILTDADGSHFVWAAIPKSAAEEKTDWTCTMHPEVSMPGPGLCPKCQMDLVPRNGVSRFEVERRTVTIGRSDGLYTAVLKGLQPGDQVVWAGHADLFPGAAVQPVEWGAGGPKQVPASSTPKTPTGSEGHDMSKMGASK